MTSHNIELKSTHKVLPPLKLPHGASKLKRSSSVEGTMAKIGKEYKETNPKLDTMRKHKTKDLYNYDYQHHEDDPRFIIDPSQMFRRTWDVLISLWVLYLCVTVPLQVAFGTNIMSEPGWKNFSIFLDAFFWVDIALNFRTGFFHAGHLEFNSKEIIKHYLGIHIPHKHHGESHACKDYLGYIPTGWFVVDLFASIPFESIFVSASKKSRKAVKLLKIFKLTKLLRMGRIIRQLPDYFKYRLVFYCLFFLVVASHLMTCLWIAIEGLGLNSVREYNFYTEDLLNTQTIDVGQVYTAALDAIMLQLFLVADARLTLGIYKNYTSIDGGTIWEEISGKTTYSHVLSILFCIVGGALQSLIWALVYKLVTNQSSMRERFRKKMDHMSEEMETLQFPLDLQHEVLHYYKLLWNQPDFYGNSPSSDYITTDMDLCYSLKIKLARHLAKLIPEIREVSIFKGCSDECIGVLVNKMRAHFFIKGNVIWQNDTIVRELIYIYRGWILEVNEVKDGEDMDLSRAEKKKNNFYGEKELLEKEDTKFGKFLIAHSEVVQVAVFPKTMIVKTLKEYQQNMTIMLKLQNRHSLLMHETSATESLIDSKIRNESKTQSPLRQVRKYSDSAPNQLLSQRINEVESQIEAMKSSIDTDKQIFERVKKLEVWTNSMDRQMEKLLKLLKDGGMG